MTENLKREQLVKLSELLKKRELKYRYKRVRHRLFGESWLKILVATGDGWWHDDRRD